MPPVGFEIVISAGERPQTHRSCEYCEQKLKCKDKLNIEIFGSVSSLKLSFDFEKIINLVTVLFSGPDIATIRST